MKTIEIQTTAMVQGRIDIVYLYNGVVCVCDVCPKDVAIYDSMLGLKENTKHYKDSYNNIEKNISLLEDYLEHTFEPKDHLFHRCLEGLLTSFDIALN